MQLSSKTVVICAFIAVVTLVILISAMAVWQIGTPFPLEMVKTVITFSAAIAGLVASTVPLFYYLRERPVGPGAPELRIAFSELSALRQQIRDLTAAKISDVASESRHALLEEVRKNLKTEVLEDIKRQLAEQVTIKGLQQRFEIMAGRLVREISALTRRGNLNLIIGVVTTMFTVAGLVYMVFATPPNLFGITNVLSLYIPRITTVIFIEVFAFFFLRLYKSALTDIKYYQDELTAIETIRIALETAHLSNVPSNVTVVITALSQARVPVQEKEEAVAAPINLKDASDIFERLGKMFLEAAKPTKA
jgi:hypothetical protein